MASADVSTLTPHVLKANVDPAVLTSLSNAAHEVQRLQCSLLFVVVPEQELSVCGLAHNPMVAIRIQPKVSARVWMARLIRWHSIVNPLCPLVAIQFRSPLGPDEKLVYVRASGLDLLL